MVILARLLLLLGIGLLGFSFPAGDKAQAAPGINGQCNALWSCPPGAVVGGCTYHLNNLGWVPVCNGVFGSCNPRRGAFACNGLDVNGAPCVILYWGC